MLIVSPQMESLFLFLQVTLVHRDTLQPVVVPNRERQMTALVGVTNTTLHRVSIPGDQRHPASSKGIFAFTDLSVRQEGYYCLRFNLFEVLDGETLHRAEIFSEIFRVYPAKTFPGMAQSTEFTDILKKHGIRVRVSKSIRTSKKLGNKVDPEPNSDAEDDSQQRLIKAAAAAASGQQPYPYNSTVDISGSPYLISRGAIGLSDSGEVRTVHILSSLLLLVHKRCCLHQIIRKRRHPRRRRTMTVGLITITIRGQHEMGQRIMTEGTIILLVTRIGTAPSMSPNAIDLLTKIIAIIQSGHQCLLHTLLDTRLLQYNILILIIILLGFRINNFLLVHSVRVLMSSAMVDIMATRTRCLVIITTHLKTPRMFIRHLVIPKRAVSPPTTKGLMGMIAWKSNSSPHRNIPFQNLHFIVIILVQWDIQRMERDTGASKRYPRDN